MDFTPGPWVADYCKIEGAERGHMHDIAATYLIPLVVSLEEAKANARLIAAAPDLLNACEMALHYFPPKTREPLCDDASCDGCQAEHSLITALEAAVNKAYGNEVTA